MTEMVSCVIDAKPPMYKEDRTDIYRIARNIESILTMEMIFIYDIQEVNCYPDNDW